MYVMYLYSMCKTCVLQMFYTCITGTCVISNNTTFNHTIIFYQSDILKSTRYRLFIHNIGAYCCKQIFFEKLAWRKLILTQTFNLLVDIFYCNMIGIQLWLEYKVLKCSTCIKKGIDTNSSVYTVFLYHNHNYYAHKYSS